MTNERLRFWTVQRNRIVDVRDSGSSQPPLFSQAKSHLLFRSGRHQLKQAIETLVRVGPLHSAPDSELFELSALISDLSSAVSVELTIRGGYRVSLLKLESDDSPASVLLSSAAEV